MAAYTRVASTRTTGKGIPARFSNEQKAQVSEGSKRVRVLVIILAVGVALHGLIHLIGFVAYWPLARIPDLPYKTALLDGRLEIGAAGMRAYSLLWLLAGLLFVAGAVMLALDRPVWAPLLLAAALLSLAVGALDWGAAWRSVLIDVALLLALGVVFGLRVRPAPFPAFTAPAPGRLERVPLPADLPAPVERFYRQTYGNTLPVYHSAVISGRGTLRLMGIPFPARVRFTHLVGQGYRHYMETTFYGRPLMRVDEHYLDGRARLKLPFGVVENDPSTDSAANQGLWAEMALYPAVYLTEPRLHWEAVDDLTARLCVPFGAEEQTFTVHFDRQSGALQRLETLRYRDARSPRLRWSAAVLPGGGRDGQPVVTATWEDQETPWLVITVEEIVLNSDVNDYVRREGP